MPTTCEIVFDHPDKVYYGGQSLRGTVHLTLEKEKTVRGIYVQIIGRAHAYWTDRTFDRDDSYIGNEDYLDETTYLIGAKDAGKIFTPNILKFRQFKFILLIRSISNSTRKIFVHF